MHKPDCVTIATAGFSPLQCDGEAIHNVVVADIVAQNLVAQNLDAYKLSYDMKLCAEVVNGFTGWLDPDAIAAHVTSGLVDTFGCAFVRIWLVEPDRRGLRLVASSGLYTRLDGSFAYVPMGRFKIGKIAQNCIPFLSNCLSEESWVKDRAWAVANNIQGFAGLPLMAGGQAIGVLAVFSETPMQPTFLEVLQMMSLSVAGALASALNHQSLMAVAERPAGVGVTAALSEELAAVLGYQRLSLLGTEQTLSAVVRQQLLALASHLKDFSYQYCRLVYDLDSVVLEALLAAKENQDQPFFTQIFAKEMAAAEALGGQLAIQSDNHRTVVSIKLQLPRKTQAEPGESIEKRTDAQRLKESSLSEKDLIGKPQSPLSDRENEVMQLLTQGLRDRDIAERLYISERTVKFHAKNVLTKLDVKTRVQAVFEATRQGWLT